MATVKLHNTEDLKKMNAKDRLDLLNKTLAELAHTKLHVRMNENKQSHKVKEFKTQVARIHTLNNQANNEK